MERREIFYSGRVQGVGFRYTTRAIAARFAVTGFVKNLADGRVQLVAEGAPEVVARFLQTLEDEMGRYIDTRQISASDATNEFKAFEIHR